MPSQGRDSNQHGQEARKLAKRTAKARRHTDKYADRTSTTQLAGPAAAQSRSDRG